MSINYNLGATVAFTYRFPAVVDHWHDGDTVRVSRGAWPGLTVVGESVRLMGCNAPELATPEGKAALAYVQKLVPVGTTVTLIATAQDKYGRFLARVILNDGSDVSQLMIAAGQAVPM